MVKQIRNDSMVNLLKADFFSRYEPNAALVHAGLHLQLPQLRGYWPFSSVNENGNAYDLSGQGRTLTNNNAVPFTWYNLLPYANLTPGSTHYFSRADEAGLDITGGLTLGGWFWLDTLASGGNQTLISKWLALGDQRSYLLYLDDATNTLVFNITSLGTAATIVGITSTTLPAINTWYHVVGRFISSTTVSIFVDGVKTDNAAGVPAAIHSGSAAFEIGSTSGGANRLDGRACQCFVSAAGFDDVIIWSAYQQTRANFGK